MAGSKLKLGLTAVVFAGVGLVAGLTLQGTDVARKVNERKLEYVGAVADKVIFSNMKEDTKLQVKTVSGLHDIEIVVDQFQDNIFRASGVGNSFLIKTSEGNVLFDGGLPTQAARQKRLLQEAADGEMKYIVLSHSHGDHTGSINLWKDEFPEAQVITHERFLEGHRYLEELKPYFWDRNRLLYTFMPEEPPSADSPLSVGHIDVDVLVRNGDVFNFELGGVKFQALPTPGAEGDDNLVLWIEDQKALFSGDFFGPLFPMVPNLFTLRGEKFRDPVRYMESLETLIKLKPELILPSHFDPIKADDNPVEGMVAMLDTTRYIHDQTVAGMNAGKSVWELMDEIKLPEELALSEGHGKVSWNVRSIWDHYSTWFKFESTTELYSVPVRTLYSELAEMGGGAAPFIAKAEARLSEQKLEDTLHFVELALAADPSNMKAYQVQLNALEALLTRAYNNGSNFSETMWLKGRISAVEKVLKEG